MGQLGQLGQMGHLGQLPIIIMYQTQKKYEYQLDKTSRKVVCPHCGRKTFVLYLDKDGRALDDSVGRCDRKDNCNWHYTPRQYFEDRFPVNGCRRKHYGQEPMKRSVPKPPDFIDGEIFSKTLRGYEGNSLLIYLHSVFDGLIGAREVDRVAMEYAVGTSRRFGGSPVFWQVDENGRIRSGKIMGYDSVTGKRVKEPRPQLAWVHSLLKDNYPGFRLQQCFFGSHRLYGDNKRKSIIWLFESEKAALIVSMALVWGNAEGMFIPVACGGCEGFNPTADKKQDPYEGIRLLRGRKIVLFPDEGKFDDWQRRAAALRGFSSEVYMATVMERSIHPFRVDCDIGKGDALDDLILRYFAEGKDVASLLMESYGYQGKYKIV